MVYTKDTNGQIQGVQLENYGPQLNTPTLADQWDKAGRVYFQKYNKILFLSRTDEPNGGIQEVYNGPVTTDLAYVDYATFDLTVKCFCASNNYLYLFGRKAGVNTLVKIDPVSYSFESMELRKYDVSAMTVTDTDFLTFSALRNDDAFVVGSVDINNNRVIESSTTFDSEITVLEQVY